MVTYQFVGKIMIITGYFPEYDAKILRMFADGILSIRPENTVIVFVGANKK